MCPKKTNPKTDESDEPDEEPNTELSLSDPDDPRLTNDADDPDDVGPPPPPPSCCPRQYRQIDTTTGHVSNARSETQK